MPVSPARPLVSKTPSRPLDPVNLFLIAVIKLLKDLDGRDKSIKIVQYLLKILIHHDRVQKRRWASTVSSCSMTRKILRLGLGLGPARQLLYERERLSFRESCLLVNEMGNTIADDLVCLYKLRLVPASVGRQSEIIANYCWLVGIANTLADTFVALQELKTMEKIDHEKIFMTRVSIAKLSMDGIFFSDIWQPPYADGVMAWAGFFSGSLATYKLWKKVSLVV
ncbi:hypothetical protein BX666DRAFT_1854757 [Dichotomocladium elegans]|nr:hypothetical protein BX666DRAFT_1854757 [Dichotomocladium elegans]